MADYRSFCKSCGAETTFGSHEKGCAAVAEWRAAEKEKRDFDRSLDEHYYGVDEKQLLAEFKRAKFKVEAYDDALRAADKKYKYLLNVLRNRNLVDIYGRLRNDGNLPQD